VSSVRTLVVGGGLFGACLALHYRQQGDEVVVYEKEGLLARASYRNQARVHRGYHYPRSFLTCTRSAVNYPRFIRDFSQAVSRSQSAIYALARVGSRVNGEQFEAFCRRAGAPIRQPVPSVLSLFDRQYIEAVFEVEECVFNASRLRMQLQGWLGAAGVVMRVGDPVDTIDRAGSGLMVRMKSGITECADRVVLAAYSGINGVLRNSGLPLLPLKHEIAEIAVVRHPGRLAQVGITVMDGPFFSTIPFPSLNAHSMTHVRYTPHISWRDREGYRDGYAVLDGYSHQSNVELMIKDACRYVPSIRDAIHVESLFEVKTVLLANEDNDGRPILLRKDYGGLKGLVVVMGGKVDNVYDVVDALAGKAENAESNSGSGV
jgi:glycine/D-amino acid oxidase-like deaminating enzyme